DPHHLRGGLRKEIRVGNRSGEAFTFEHPISSNMQRLFEDLVVRTLYCRRKCVGKRYAGLHHRGNDATDALDNREQRDISDQWKSQKNLVSSHPSTIRLLHPHDERNESDNQRDPKKPEFLCHVGETEKHARRQGQLRAQMLEELRE